MLRVSSLLFLVLATTASAQTVLVLRDGSRLDVAGYEVRGGVVVITRLDGRLESIPAEHVDLAATEAAGAVEPEVEVVPLHFRWSPGSTARVEVETSREQTAAQPSEVRSTRMRLSYRMTVRDHAEGLLVDLDDFRFPEDHLPAEAQESALAQVQLERIAAMTPSYVVGREGEFVDVVDIEELVAEVEALLAPARSAIGEGNEAARALIDRVLSEDHLRARISEEWNLLVGFWAGGDLELGALYELETTAPIPLMPVLAIPMRLEFEAVRWTPCETGLEESHCVELRLHSHPDPEKTEVLIASLLEQLAGASDVPSFEELHVEQSATLVVAPETMLPYSLETMKSFRMSGRARGNPVSAFRDDRRTMRFRWAP